MKFNVEKTNIYEGSLNFVIFNFIMIDLISSKIPVEIQNVLSSKFHPKYLIVAILRKHLARSLGLYV